MSNLIVSIALFLLFSIGLFLLKVNDLGKNWARTFWFFFIYMLMIPLIYMEPYFLNPSFYTMFKSILTLILFTQLFRICQKISPRNSNSLLFFLIFLILLNLLLDLLMMFLKNPEGNSLLYGVIHDPLMRFYLHSITFLFFILLGFWTAKKMEPQSSSRSSHFLIWFSLTLMILQSHSLYSLNLISMPIDQYLMPFSLFIALVVQRSNYYHRRRKAESGELI